MKGFVNIFVNRDEFQPEEENKVIDLIKKYSPQAVEDCKNAGYPLMFLTTTKEASRAEKVDFDQPFPRKKPKEGLAYGEEVGCQEVEELKEKVEQLFEMVNKLSKEKGDD